MIKKFRAWLYKKAFDYVMGEHREYTATNGLSGKRLSFHTLCLESVDFADAVFLRSSFTRSKFTCCPFRKTWFDHCDMASAEFHRGDFPLARLNFCAMDGVDWTGTFSGVMKERVERLAARAGTPEDLDGVSVVATESGAKLQLDEPVLPRIKPSKNKKK
jgi:hypothetical protein